jgi:hypothetical protein
VIKPAPLAFLPRHGNSPARPTLPLPRVGPADKWDHRVVLILPAPVHACAPRTAPPSHPYARVRTPGQGTSPPTGCVVQTSRQGRCAHAPAAPPRLFPFYPRAVTHSSDRRPILSGQVSSASPRSPPRPFSPCSSPANPCKPLGEAPKQGNSQLGISPFGSSVRHREGEREKRGGGGREKRSQRASPPRRPAGVEDPEAEATRELEEAVRDEAVQEQRSRRIAAIPTVASTPMWPSLLCLHLRPIVSLFASFA